VSAIAPYGNEAADALYNLLFCDEPALFAGGAAEHPDAPLAAILSDTPDAARITAIANDAAQESRIRALAFNWLRRNGHDVPKRGLLGTIVEVPLERGLDTLAAFADGGARYIHQTGQFTVFDGAYPPIQPVIATLLGASRKVVDQIGPWEKPRLGPPKPGNIRMTFLVSDGLYFGEGKSDELMRDPLGGPVIQAAVKLLQACVALAAQKR
jgi:hypothetical protein